MTTPLRDRVRQNRENGVAERRAQLTPLEVPVPAELADSKPVIRRPMVPPQSRKPEWQRFNRGASRGPGGMTITINRSGRVIAFSRQAREALGSPAFVEVHVCDNPRMVGFRPAHTDDDQAFRVFTASTGGTSSIACTGLVKSLGVDTSVGRRYRAVMQGDMLVVSLDADNAVELGSKAVTRE